MNHPKLTVIVPTRERADTLFHTLRTLVGQTYLDCEFLVSDNFSQDNTKEVVESFADSRIIYINPGARLSMADNWEFALAHACGEYVTYIGDDDGFVFDALKNAMGIIEKTKLNALVWGKIEYCWPDHIDEGLRNWFSIKNRPYGLHIMDGQRKLKQVIRARDSYTSLPCLYNGIVRRSLINDIKAQSSNGIFFNAISPDIYSGIALSAVVGRYIYTDYPFSLNGASRHSNGTSYMRELSNSETDSPRKKFNSENKRSYDPRILVGPATVICVMGEYLLARQHLVNLGLPEPPWKNYVNSLVRVSGKTLFPLEIFKSAEHTANILGIKITRSGPLKKKHAQSTLKGFSGDAFQFFAPKRSVSNIFDACELVGGMLPDIGSVTVVSASGVFFTQLRNFLLIELKKLYRIY